MADLAQGDVKEPGADVADGAGVDRDLQLVELAREVGVRAGLRVDVGAVNWRGGRCAAAVHRHPGPREQRREVGQYRHLDAHRARAQLGLRRRRVELPKAGAGGHSAAAGAPGALALPRNLARVGPLLECLGAAVHGEVEVLLRGGQVGTQACAGEPRQYSGPRVSRPKASGSPASIAIVFRPRDTADEET